MNKDSEFIYFVCIPENVSLLKREIKCFYPELAFAFSQGGFVTYKIVRPLKKELKIVFSLFHGKFIKKDKPDSMLNFFNELKSPKVHLDQNFQVKHKAEYNLGDEVFELIELSEKEYYLGSFIASSVSRYVNEELDQKSPSRAYLKIVEAKKKLSLDFANGETALEIGSSPGGATYALLKMNLNVIGVDPGEMDKVCLEYKTFKHFRKSIQDFKIKDIESKKIDWLLVDMNLAPEATLKEIEKIFEFIRPTFKGAFITMKMTKLEKVDQINFYQKIIKKMNLCPAYMGQLPSHKQEFLLFVTKLPYFNGATK